MPLLTTSSFWLPTSTTSIDSIAHEAPSTRSRKGKEEKVHRSMSYLVWWVPIAGEGPDGAMRVSSTRLLGDSGLLSEDGDAGHGERLRAPALSASAPRAASEVQITPGGVEVVVRRRRSGLDAGRPRTRRRHGHGGREPGGRASDQGCSGSESSMTGWVRSEEVRTQVPIVRRRMGVPWRRL